MRTIGNEVLVGKTKYSYVYTQPLRSSGGYIMYHGTLEVRALSPTTTQLYYTLVYDNSNLADDAAREAELARRRNTFTGMLQNMKILSEGGTLPPGEKTSTPVGMNVANVEQINLSARVP